MDSFRSIRALLNKTSDENSVDSQKADQVRESESPIDVECSSPSPPIISSNGGNSSSALLAALQSGATIENTTTVTNNDNNNNNNNNNNNDTATTNINEQPQKCIKAKKRAAFEAWHRKKLEQISNGKSAKFAVKMECGSSSDDNQVTSTTDPHYIAACVIRKRSRLSQQSGGEDESHSSLEALHRSMSNGSLTMSNGIQTSGGNLLSNGPLMQPTALDFMRPTASQPVSTLASRLAMGAQQLPQSGPGSGPMVAPMGTINDQLLLALLIQQQRIAALAAATSATSTPPASPMVSDLLRKFSSSNGCPSPASTVTANSTPPVHLNNSSSPQMMEHQLRVQPPSSSQVSRCPSATTPSSTIGGKRGKPHGSLASTTTAKELTAPKLSRHNDAAYYPNIQCILCKEWVCSRNRYMHIESHLQYRPYKCNMCGYDNRKEIFINLHIKRNHGNNAEVVYKPDPELEHRAWLMAEQCLQHTREILTQQNNTGGPESSNDNDNGSIKIGGEPGGSEKGVKPKMDATLLARYAGQFRPKIFNSQRAEKSQLIEESRQMGLVPDFSEVASREAQCKVCEAHILNHQSVLEEHARTHLSQPSYRCTIDGCTTEHHSKNFLTRHMKEVHKYRRTPLDLLELHEKLMNEYLSISARCFPHQLIAESGTVGRKRHVRTQSDSDFASASDNHHNDQTQSQNSITAHLDHKAIAAQISLPSSKNNTGTGNSSSGNNAATPTSNNNNNNNTNNSINNNNSASAVLEQLRRLSNGKLSTSQKMCNLCQTGFPDDYATIYGHVKTHLSLVPYQCRICRFGDTNKCTVEEHILKEHNVRSTSTEMNNRMTAGVAQQCHLLLAACFPHIILKPWLHDEICV